MDLGLEGKLAVVLGGSKGIGRAVALELAAEGCDVAIAARGKAALKEAAGAIETAGRRAVPVPADLSTAEGIEALFAVVDADLGGVDVLVNVTGADALIGHTLEETTDEMWRAALDIGLMAIVRSCRAAAPRMRARGGGRIVNISAMSIHRQFPPLIAYTAAKSAVASVSKNLARTLAPDGILVNTVCPGIVMTEGLRSAFPSAAGTTEEVEADIMQHVADIGGVGRGLIPDLGRAGRPEEIAAMVAFLAGARASYVTGATINVDGGTDF